VQAEIHARQKTLVQQKIHVRRKAGNHLLLSNPLLLSFHPSQSGGCFFNGMLEIIAEIL
jgi:hypothetical protein